MVSIGKNLFKLFVVGVALFGIASTIEAFGKSVLAGFSVLGLDCALPFALWVLYVILYDEL